MFYRISLYFPLYKCIKRKKMYYLLLFVFDKFYSTFNV